MHSARLSSKGHVTIPKALRTALGWQAGEALLLVQVKHGLEIRAATAKPGDILVAHLRGKGNRTHSAEDVATLTRGDESI
jgi:AbrB family looped-hinge helix DNA binding protein